MFRQARNSTGFTFTYFIRVLIDRFFIAHCCNAKPQGNHSNGTSPPSSAPTEHCRKNSTMETAAAPSMSSRRNASLHIRIVLSALALLHIIIERYITVKYDDPDYPKNTTGYGM